MNKNSNNSEKHKNNSQSKIKTNSEGVIKVKLMAPLSGFIVPLGEVPDPVFSQKMVGDGVSIDPTSQILVSPCDGEISLIHSSFHALTILSPEGLQIMIHIGLETVKLKGQGFKAKVKVGQKVKRGDPLIEFDAEFVGNHAKSLLTEIIITNMEIVEALHSAQGSVQSEKDLLLEVELKGLAGKKENQIQKTGQAQTQPQSQAQSQRVTQNSDSNQKSLAKALSSEELIILTLNGLHARPAAQIVNTAKRFKSEIVMQKDNQTANAKSLVALMSLGVNYKDKITFQASGEEAQLALNSLIKLIKEDLDDEGGRSGSQEKENEGKTLSNANNKEGPSSAEAGGESPSLVGGSVAETKDPRFCYGVSASPGFAIGSVFQWRQDEIAVHIKGSDPLQEGRIFQQALDLAKVQLEALKSKLLSPSNFPSMTSSASTSASAKGANKIDAGKAAIFTAHQEVLDDPDLLMQVEKNILNGKSAAYAWKEAYSEQADKLSKMKNVLLAARANDIKDVGRRVLRLITGVEAEAPKIPAQSVLIAEDLSPSDVAHLDPKSVLGLCTTTGGASSHVAILARTMDIPFIAGIDPRALDIQNGSTVLIDGGKAALNPKPSTEEIEQFKKWIEQKKNQKESDLSTAFDPAITIDGYRVEVVANIGDLKDAEKAIKLGGEGVGLLRSEFLFLERTRAPSEEEQFEAYRSIAKALGPEKPLVIRTLDVGGDKPLSYLPIPREDNPFLGKRGIRVSLDHPDVFREQVRAALRAAVFGSIKMMFPMIATLSEWRCAKAIVEEERLRLGIDSIPVGIMMEVPVVAMMAEQFAKEVDFFSIGTNDLTQYTLAMDRGHPKMAPFVDALNPGVLHLILLTVKAAHKYGKKVSVCGGIASDPQGVPILLGLGVDSLSVSVPSLPAIKAQIRKLNRTECERWAYQALLCESAEEVRALCPE